MKVAAALVALAVAYSAPVHAAGALSASSPAGDWYEVTHEDRDAWIAHAARVVKTSVPRERLEVYLRDCIRETAEPYEKLDLATVTALCVQSAR